MIPLAIVYSFLGKICCDIFIKNYIFFATNINPMALDLLCALKDYFELLSAQKINFNGDGDIEI